jgi:predicted esterase
LEEFLADLPVLLGFQPGPLVLGGFSQGGTTSLVYALTRPGSVDGIVNLSGVPMETRSYPMGHWVNPDEMQDLKDWLSREVPGWSRTEG